MNIFGKELELQKKKVIFRGVTVIVTEIMDEEYHQHVTLPMCEREREEREEVVEFNREATQRMLALALVPGLQMSFDDIYTDLRTPGKYPRSFINALLIAMNEVNGTGVGNSPTTTSDSD